MNNNKRKYTIEYTYAGEIFSWSATTTSQAMARAKFRSIFDSDNHKILSIVSTPVLTPLEPKELKFEIVSHNGLMHSLDVVVDVSMPSALAQFDDKYPNSLIVSISEVL